METKLELLVLKRVMLERHEAFVFQSSMNRSDNPDSNHDWSMIND